jgi:hypothetical protein
VWIAIKYDSIQHQTHRVSREVMLNLLPTLTVQFRCSPYRFIGVGNQSKFKRLKEDIKEREMHNQEEI